MTIKQRVTVTQFEVRRVGLILHEPSGELESVADVVLLNEFDQIIQKDHVNIPWSAAQETALIAAIRSKKTAYANTYGWTEHIPTGEGP